MADGKPANENARRSLIGFGRFISWLLMWFEVSRCLECLNEGGLANALVAAHKHFGHVQRHSARVEQAQQVALLIVDGAGGAGEAVGGLKFIAMPSKQAQQ